MTVGSAFFFIHGSIFLLLERKMCDIIINVNQFNVMLFWLDYSVVYFLFEIATWINEKSKIGYSNIREI